MALKKRVYSNTQKIFIYGSGTFLAFFFLLLGLSNLGVTITTSGDITCGKDCISYFNITLENYSLCFGSTFQGLTFDQNISYELYKADMRYRPDNPARWKPYQFKSGICLDRGKTYEFKLVGHKAPTQTIKWGIGYGFSGVDPYWYGVQPTNILGEIQATREIRIIKQDYLDRFFTYEFKEINDTHWKVRADINPAFLTALRVIKNYNCSSPVWRVLRDRYLPGQDYTKICNNLKNMTHYPARNLTSKIHISNLRFEQDFGFLTADIVFPDGWRDGEIAEFGFGTTQIDTITNTGVSNELRAICRDSDGVGHIVFRRNSTHISYGKDNTGVWVTNDTAVDENNNNKADAHISCNGLNITVCYEDTTLDDIIIYKSENGGTSFTKLTSPVTSGVNSYVQCERRGNTIYGFFLNTSNRLNFIKSTDGGSSFSSPTNMTPYTHARFSVVVTGDGGASDRIASYAMYDTTQATKESASIISTDSGSSWTSTPQDDCLSGGYINLGYNGSTSSPMYYFAQGYDSSCWSYFGNGTDMVTFSDYYIYSSTYVTRHAITPDPSGNAVIFYLTNIFYSNRDVAIKIFNKTTASLSSEYLITNDTEADSYISSRVDYSNGKAEFLWRRGTSSPYKLMYEFVSYDGTPNILGIPWIIQTSVTKLTDNINCTTWYNGANNGRVEFGWWLQNTSGTFFMSAYNGSTPNNVQDLTRVYTNVSLSNSTFNKGDNITCTARAYNGSTYSEWVNSSAITVGNSPPTIVNQQSYVEGQKQFTVTATATDPDGLSDISSCLAFYKLDENKTTDDFTTFHNLTNKTGTYTSADGNCSTVITTSDKGQLRYGRSVVSDTDIYPHTLTVDNNYVFVTEATSTSGNDYLYKLAEVNATQLGSTNLGLTSNSKRGICQNTDFIIAATQTSNIYKINKTSLSYITKAMSTTSYTCTANDDFYFGGDSNYAIYKYNNDDDTLATSRDFGSGTFYDLHFNPTTDFLYSGDSAGIVMKINATDFTDVKWSQDKGSLTVYVVHESSTDEGDWIWAGDSNDILYILNEGDGVTNRSGDFGTGSITEIVSDTDYVYFTSTDDNLRKLKKSEARINSDFTIDASEGEWALNFGEDLYGLDKLGNYLYVLSTSMKVWKVDINSGRTIEIDNEVVTKTRFCDVVSSCVDTNGNSTTVLQAPTGYPIYSDNSTNSTLENSPIKHSLKWTDTSGLSGFIFSFCDDNKWNTTLEICQNISTVKLQTANSENLRDASVDRSNPNTNYGTSTNLDIGSTGGLESRYRDYFMFNTSSIPSGAVITDAKLWVYLGSAVGFSTDIRVYHVYNWTDNNTDNPVDETSITYNNQPCGNNTAQIPSGTKYCNTTYETQIAIQNVGWYSMSITKMTQTAISQGQKNLSMMIGTSAGTWSSYFYSKEHGTTANRPYLNITYYFNDFKNDSWVAMGGTSNWSNVTKTITTPAGGTVGWCVYANDTDNNWNYASCLDPFTYLVTEAGLYVDSCRDLNQSAEYKLSANINNFAGSECFNITNSSVTLDCQGYTIDGQYPSVTNQVAVYGRGANASVTIKNCVFSDVEVAVQGWDGDNWVVKDNSGEGAIYVQTAENWNVTNNNLTILDTGDTCVDFGGTGSRFTNNIFSGCGYGLDLDYASNTYIENNTMTGDGTQPAIYVMKALNVNATFNSFHNFTDGVECFSDSGFANYSGSRFWNNLFNVTDGTWFTQDAVGYCNYIWNVTKQSGTRIPTPGSEEPASIGGNYYTNTTGNGFSDTCVDDDFDGYCDSTFTLATNNIDYLPYSDEYGNAPSPMIQVVLNTPTDPSDWIYGTEYYVNATATCKYGACGNVTGYLRYNQSGALPSERIGGLQNYLWRAYSTGTYDEFSAPTVVNGIVYIGAKDHPSGSGFDGVFAINASTGQQIWNTTGIGMIDGAPTYYNGTIIVSSYYVSGSSTVDDITVLNATNGSIICQYDMESTGGPGTVAVWNGIAYVGGFGDPYVYAIYANNCSQYWKVNPVSGGPYYFPTSPTVDDKDQGCVFLTGNDGNENFMCLNKTDGSTEWEISVDTFWDSSPVIINNGEAVCAISTGTYDDVYCRNTTDGSAYWTWGATYGGYGTSAYDKNEGMLYVTDGCYIVKLNTTHDAISDAQREIWTTAVSYGSSCFGVYSSIALTDEGILFVGTRGDADEFRELLSLNMTSGAIIHRYTIGADIFSSPAVGYGKVFIAADDWYLYAFDVAWNDGSTDAGGWYTQGHDWNHTGYTYAGLNRYIMNPLSCGNMSQNDVCNLSWKLNATQNIGTSWEIDVNFTATSVSNNHTSDSTVNIIQGGAGGAGLNWTWGPPSTSLLRWLENSTGGGCGPTLDSTWVQPENQTGSYGIFYMCNNGTGYGTIQGKNSGTPNTGWTIYWSGTSSTGDAVQMTTTYQNIKGLNAQSCTYIWGFARCQNVIANPGITYKFQIQ